MIAKALVLYLVVILLPDLYLYLLYVRRFRWWWHLLWWVPSLVLTVATILLAREPNFVPDSMTGLYLYLFLVGFVVMPKLSFSVFSLLGRHGWKAGLATVPIIWFILFYGTFVGSRQLEVKHVEVTFDQLPAAFDGYRITLFSDVHAGSMSGERIHFLKAAVDSINAQQSDVIIFAGDLQNQRPQEVEPFQQVLSQLKAPDGIFSVLGNHDYADYLGDEVSYVEKYDNEDYIVSLQHDMGWTVLNNSRRYIHRGADSIVIAGMENDGVGHFPAKGDIARALWGVTLQQFVVMIEHDPTSWRRHILPRSHSQLTLSGHTHAMQFELFGWSPVAFLYKEYDGLYQKAGRYLYVTKGLGGVIPFRFGAPGEIVVLTLRSKPLSSKH